MFDLQIMIAELHPWESARKMHVTKLTFKIKLSDFVFDFLSLETTKQ